MAEVFERKNTISFSIVCLHHQSHSPAGFRVIKTIFIDKTLNFTEQSAFKHSLGCGSSTLPILPACLQRTSLDQKLEAAGYGLTASKRVLNS